MSETDSSIVKIRLTEEAGNTLVIEYTATPDQADEKSRECRKNHHDRLKVLYAALYPKQQRSEFDHLIKIIDARGKIELTMEFKFTINTSTGVDGKHSVWTAEMANILFIQKHFFKLDFEMIKKSGKDPKDCEFRLEKEYGYEEWNRAVSTHGPNKDSGRKTQEDAKEEKEKKSMHSKLKFKRRAHSSKKNGSTKKDDSSSKGSKRKTGRIE